MRGVFGAGGGSCAWTGDASLLVTFGNGATLVPQFRYSSSSAVADDDSADGAVASGDAGGGDNATRLNGIYLKTGVLRAAALNARCEVGSEWRCSLLSRGRLIEGRSRLVTTERNGPRHDCVGRCDSNDCD